MNQQLNKGLQHVDGEVFEMGGDLEEKTRTR